MSLIRNQTRPQLGPILIVIIVNVKLAKNKTQSNIMQYAGIYARTITQICVQNAKRNDFTKQLQIVLRYESYTLCMYLATQPATLYP